MLAYMTCTIQYNNVGQWERHLEKKKTKQGIIRFWYTCKQFWGLAHTLALILDHWCHSNHCFLFYLFRHSFTRDHNLQSAGGSPASLRLGRWLDFYSGPGSVGIEANTPKSLPSTQLRDESRTLPYKNRTLTYRWEGVDSFIYSSS